MTRKHGRAIFSGLVLLVIVGISILLLVSIVIAEPLDTHHSSWHLIRETAAEDDTNFVAVYDLAGAEGDFASKDSSTVVNGGPFRIPSIKPHAGAPEGTSPGGAWMFAISGGVAINDIFSFDIVGWAKTNGMAQILATGDGIVGTQDVVLYPDDGATATNIWWVDTINIDVVSNWPGSIGVYNSGNNQVCIIVIDMTGIEWVQFVFYDALSGQAGEADPLTVFGRRY